MTKIFLGGTCNNSTWRDQLIPQLKVDYFNPVVADWTPEAQAEEERQKDLCNVHLYVISKEIIGFFSIAEVIDSCYRKDKRTIFYGLLDGFDVHQQKSLYAVSQLAAQRGAAGAAISTDLDILVQMLNAYAS